MPVDPNTKSLLELKLVNNKAILLNNKNNKTYPIVDKVLYSVNLESDQSYGEYIHMITYNKYDRAVSRIIGENPCIKCKCRLINFLLLGERKKRIFICSNCNYNWYND